MGTQPVGRVALMSIHPQYALAILEGTKKVEFRKKRIAEDVTHVLVYATAPTSAIIGAFTVVGQATEHPQRLWDLFARVGGISREGFFSYYANRLHGTGIKVGQVLIAEDPLPLRETLGVARPPQSFQYVCSAAAGAVLDSMNPSPDLQLAHT